MFFPFQWLQDRINFIGCTSPQFCHDEGLGRVAAIAAILGLILGINLTLYICVFFFVSPEQEEERRSAWLLWFGYICVLCLFHLSEFFVTAIYNPMATTSDSFLVNHSLKYTMAVSASMIEFWCEYYFVPSWKQHSEQIVYFGLVLVIGGSLCRQIAMATCGSNFHHKIQLRQHSTHSLVTTGIYKYLRHPSYVGWFYWSIGTQILLLNPVCTFLYFLAAWQFFRIRIPFEEDLLTKQYPNDYPAYMKRTYIGIPFVWS